MKLGKILSKSILLMAILFLVACNTPAAPAQPQPPTQDSKVIRTEAVQTAMAQLTVQAAANPSSTPVPVQPSPRPVTATSVPPTVPPTVAPTVTAVPTLTYTSVPVIVYKTFTPTVFNPNKARVLSTDPKDWSTIAANTDFDIRWWVRNVGSEDWTTAFYYQYVSGAKWQRKDYYYLPQNVPINSEIQLVVDAKSGLEPGLWTTRWGLYDNKGNLFQLMTLSVYLK